MFPTFTVEYFRPNGLSTSQLNELSCHLVGLENLPKFIGQYADLNKGFHLGTCTCTGLHVWDSDHLKNPTTKAAFEAAINNWRSQEGL